MHRFATGFQLVMSGPSIERDTVSVRGLAVNSYELMENCQCALNNFLATDGQKKCILTKSLSEASTFNVTSLFSPTDG